MKSADERQDAQIAKLESDSKLMRAVLVLNSLAAIAQILECWRIWHWGK